MVGAVVAITPVVGLLLERTGVECLPGLLSGFGLLHFGDDRARAGRLLFVSTWLLVIDRRVGG